MKPTRHSFIPIFVATLLAVLPSVWAGARKVHVQGKLTDSGGTPLSGAQTVTFKLYDAATGGTMVWTSGVLSVTPTSGGLFNVPLQDGTPSLDTVSFDKPYYVGITVGADPEMAPRQEMGSSFGSVSDFQVKNNLVVKSGKFGLGTDSPGTPVHIVAPAVQMTVEGTANQSAQIEMIDHQSNAKKWRFVSGMNNRGSLQVYQATDNIEAVEISPNGNVGIGTTNPNDKLDVGGNIRMSGGGKSILFSDPGNYDFSVVHNGGGSLDIRSPEYGVTIASFFNNGNVGIGRVIPTQKLDVNGSVRFGTGGGYLYSSVPDNFTLQTVTNSPNPNLTIGYGTGAGPGIIDSSREHFVMNGGKFMFLKGNIGVGTMSPAYSLDVVGIIRGNNVTPSDRNLKMNLRPLSVDTLYKVTQLSGKTFEWDKRRIREVHQSASRRRGETMAETSDSDPSVGYPDGPQIGLVAQEVEALFPQLVVTDADGVKSVSYMGVTAVLLEAVKEQSKRIDALRREVEALKKKAK